MTTGEQSSNRVLIDYPGGFHFDEEPRDDELKLAWRNASVIARFWVERLYGTPPEEEKIPEWFRGIRADRLRQLQQ